MHKYSPLFHFGDGEGEEVDGAGGEVAAEGVDAVEHRCSGCDDIVDNRDRQAVEFVSVDEVEGAADVGATLVSVLAGLCFVRLQRDKIICDFAIQLLSHAEGYLAALIVAAAEEFVAMERHRQQNVEGILQAIGGELCTVHQTETTCGRGTVVILRLMDQPRIGAVGKIIEPAGGNVNAINARNALMDSVETDFMEIGPGKFGQAVETEQVFADGQRLPAHATRARKDGVDTRRRH